MLLTKIIRRSVAMVLPRRVLAVGRFVTRHGYWPHVRNPRSFSEKVQYIKLYNRNPMRVAVADREAVREFVQRRVPACELPQILWTGAELTQSVWDALPRKFVVKASHGSGMTNVVDKRADSLESVASAAQRWLKTDYERFSGEWWYSKLRRYLIVEGWIGPETKVPSDFKFFCSAGRVLCVQVDLDRFGEHRRAILGSDGKQLDVALEHPIGDVSELPDNWKEGVSIAEKLSEPFDFIRVDLYFVDSAIVFGELTNAPGNGFERFRPQSFDFKLGGACPSKVDR